MTYDPLDFTEPNVCVDENLTTDDAGVLQIQPFAVPRPVIDVRGTSGADGKLHPEQSLPGKLLIDIRGGWRNTGPLEADIRVRIIRGPKNWVTSNPNAIQFRDRWTYTIDPDDITPEPPITTGIFDSQCGSAIDVGTNSVAEPDPGKQWVWTPVTAVDRWIGPVPPGSRLNIWYQQYVWTPPPFSDNANKNSPEHKAFGNWARLWVWAHPVQGSLVTG